MPDVPEEPSVPLVPEEPEVPEVAEVPEVPEVPPPLGAKFIVYLVLFVGSTPSIYSIVY